jgi:hypothetical protein
MSLTIDLPDQIERRLRDEAALRGLTPDEFVRAVLEERLASGTQLERNQRAIELLQGWLVEEPDLEESTGYPEQITRFTIREPKLG